MTMQTVSLALQADMNSFMRPLAALVPSFWAQQMLPHKAYSILPSHVRMVCSRIFRGMQLQPPRWMQDAAQDATHRQHSKLPKPYPSCTPPASVPMKHVQPELLLVCMDCPVREIVHQALLVQTCCSTGVQGHSRARLVHQQARGMSCCSPDLKFHGAPIWQADGVCKERGTHCDPAGRLKETLHVAQHKAGLAHALQDVQKSERGSSGCQSIFTVVAGSNSMLMWH